MQADKAESLGSDHPEKQKKQSEKNNYHPSTGAAIALLETPSQSPRNDAISIARSQQNTPEVFLPASTISD